jgi:hypothetical protein
MISFSDSNSSEVFVFFDDSTLPPTETSGTTSPPILRSTPSSLLFSLLRANFLATLRPVIIYTGLHKKLSGFINSFTLGSLHNAEMSLSDGSSFSATVTSFSIVKWPFLIRSRCAPAFTLIFSKNLAQRPMLKLVAVSRESFQFFSVVSSACFQCAAIAWVWCLFLSARRWLGTVPVETIVS